MHLGFEGEGKGGVPASINPPYSPGFNRKPVERSGPTQFNTGPSESKGGRLMKITRIIHAPLIVLLLSAVAVAQVTQEQIAELEEIVVTATHKTRMLDTPASISIITARELEQMGVKNIVEALRKIPGVYDTSSKDAAISIRGTRSSMAGGPVILIDGVAQKIGDYRYDELSFIPVSQIERIEVLRSAGIAYGPGAARGVINVITKKGVKDKGFGFDGTASYGSWETTDDYVSLYGGVKKWDYLLSGAYYNTDGYEQEDEKRASILTKLGYNLSKKTRMGVRGNIIDRDSKSAYGFAKKKWQLDHFRRDIHFPKSATDPTLWWHTEKDQDVSSVALEFSHNMDALSLNSCVSWSGYEETYRDLHYLYIKPKNIYVDDKEQDAYNFTLSSNYNINWQDMDYVLSLGINYEDIDFHQDRIYPNNPAKDLSKYVFDIDETQYGLLWDNDFLLKEKWGLKVGVRVDKAKLKFKDRVPTKVDQERTMWSFAVAPSYHFSPSGNIYVSAGRNYWFPTPRYFAWAAERGGDLNKPEDLEPEESLTYEAGYKHMINKALQINLITFLTIYKDKFASFYDITGTWRGIKNLGDAEYKGIEFEGNGRLCQWFGYRVSGTYLDAQWTKGEARVYDHPSNTRVMRDLDGKEVDRIPKYTCVVGMDLYPLKGLKLSADVNYYGSYYVDYLNRIEYGARTTVDANLTYGLKNWKFWLLGKNIFDREVEAVINPTGRLTGPNGEPDNAYYVQDGRYFEAGVSYHF